jgi:ectoine hydroxylase-related dioxygenase (phytanoyl-CoA dioxygenase family)
VVGEIARPLRRATRAGLTAALFDIHPGSGICYVMPGTHRTAWPRILAEILAERPEFSQTLDRFATDRAAAQAGWRRDILPLAFQRTAAAIAGVPRVTFPLDKGDVVLFSPSVIHGTMARSDAMLPRKVMISEWRARIAMIHHPGEHFGVAYDHRQRPGAGIPADRDAMHSSLGLCCDPYRPAYR